MKVAVSSEKQNLNALLDHRFGRCSYFLIVNTDKMSFEVIKNESADLYGNASSQAAHFLSSKGVEAVITGNCGPTAIKILLAAGVKMFIGQTGTIKNIIERFKKGELTPINEVNNQNHFGFLLGNGIHSKRDNDGASGLSEKYQLIKSSFTVNSNISGIGNI